MINPRNIPGLTLWLDANDVSTINNGKLSDIDAFSFSHPASPKQVVSSITDKVGGVKLTNASGPTGPSYIFNGVNGKNAIHFPYYPPKYNFSIAGGAGYSPPIFASLLNTATSSISDKALVAQNVTALSSGTYSLFCVFRPSEVRGVTASKDMWLFSIWNQDVIPTITDQTSLSLKYPDRGLKVSGIGYATVAQRGGWPNAGYITFRQNGDITYHETVNNNPATASQTILLDNYPSSFRTSKTGNFYQYGKTQINIIRSTQNIKKHKILRPDFKLRDQFQPRTNSKTSDILSVNNPTLVLGSFWPGQNIGVTISKTVSDNFNPFEGYFCEMLCYDRQLTDTETNVIETYLYDKWIGSESPSYPTEGLALCLDPTRVDCLDGRGPRVFDLSDSRIVGTVTGTMSRIATTYSGVFLSNGGQPNLPTWAETPSAGFNFLRGDRRLSFYDNDGFTSHTWIMPRMTDGQWFNTPGKTSSTYPNDFGSRHINIYSNGELIFNISKASIAEGVPMLDNYTIPYNPTTNPTYWTTYHAWFIYYAAGNPVSGTFSGLSQSIQFKNNEWNLLTSRWDRTTTTNGQGYRINTFINGVRLPGQRSDGPSFHQGTRWFDYSNNDWVLGGNFGYGWYGANATRGVIGYYGLYCLYNRPMSDTEVLDFYNMTKGRYGL